MRIDLLLRDVLELSPRPVMPPRARMYRWSARECHGRGLAEKPPVVAGVLSHVRESASSGRLTDRRACCAAQQRRSAARQSLTSDKSERRRVVHLPEPILERSLGDAAMPGQRAQRNRLGEASLDQPARGYNGGNTQSRNAIERHAARCRDGVPKMIGECCVDLATMLGVRDVPSKAGRSVCRGACTYPQRAARNPFTRFDHKKEQHSAARHEEVKTRTSSGQHEIVGAQRLAEKTNGRLLRRQRWLRAHFRSVRSLGERAHCGTLCMGQRLRQGR